MKKFRKLLALVLVVCMVCAVSTTAWAYGSPSPYTIFGDDDREAIMDTTSNPANAICNLTITYSNQVTEYGTGFLVTPTKVVTAAHILYNYKTGAVATKIIVAPGDTTSGHPYNRKTVTGSANMKYPSQYKSTGSANYDYGVIRLPSSFTGTSTLTLNSSYSTNDLIYMDSELYGYDYATAQLWRNWGYVEDATSTLLYHKMDTLPGMSGSPILDRYGDVVGISAYGIPGNFTWEDRLEPVPDDYDGHNYGPRITAAVETFIEQNGN